MNMITKPRWSAPQACKTAGIGQQHLRNFRCEFVVNLGKQAPSRKWEFSTLDIAELTAAEALRASGLRAAAAFAMAHKLRPTLHEALTEQLVHGRRSVGNIEIPGDGPLTKRALNVDAIAGCVINKLGLTRRGGASVKQRQIEQATQ